MSTSAACAPEQLDVRSRSGGIRVVVPAGRYRIDAESDGGDVAVRGLTRRDDAPFRIQALSGTGDIDLAAGP